ncbi:MAG: CDP-alcohol phosphatidyltransferase family protein [Deltaproteobacteria bacterium]|nr:CDP-alcohol phosphatidyltransferase family protein [Deltaproteobacteria bacterium]
MLRNTIEKRIEPPLNALAQALVRHNISPSMLTFVGLVGNGIAACLYGVGFVVAGGIMILFAGLFDMLDGAVARAGGKASGFGGFLDSVVDRYSDFLIFGGVLALFAREGDFLMTSISAITLCGAFLVSYIRARAELIIPKCAVGLMERPERIIVLAAGSLFGFFHVALWFLAVATHMTALYRIVYTHEAAKASGQHKNA